MVDPYSMLTINDIEKPTPQQEKTFSDYCEVFFKGCFDESGLSPYKVGELVNKLCSGLLEQNGALVLESAELIDFGKAMAKGFLSSVVQGSPKAQKKFFLSAIASEIANPNTLLGQFARGFSHMNVPQKESCPDVENSGDLKTLLRLYREGIIDEARFSELSAKL